MYSSELDEVFRLKYDWNVNNICSKQSQIDLIQSNLKIQLENS